VALTWRPLMTKETTVVVIANLEVLIVAVISLTSVSCAGSEGLLRLAIRIQKVVPRDRIELSTPGFSVE
jgi:hypothetical protein